MQQSDLSFPHLPYLREKCLERLRQHPFEGWQPKEITVISALIGMEVRARIDRDPVLKTVTTPAAEDPMIESWVKDLRMKIPKWVVLLSWLDPHGLVTEIPIVVAKSVIYALGDDRRQMLAIENEIDPKLVNYRLP